MKHYGLTIDLKDDPQLIAQYKAHHANPWPEPLLGLREIGIIDMKIFLLGTRMFMYMTSTDEFVAERDFLHLRGAQSGSGRVGCAHAHVPAAGAPSPRGGMVGGDGHGV